MLRKTGLSRFMLCNDAFLGVPAGCPGGAGICAINGTGSTVAAVDHSDTLLQVGGVGDVSGDFGGGSWYGMRAISAVYHELFKLGRPTVMREMLFALLGISNKDEYHDAVTDGVANGTIRGVALSSIVFNAADSGDEIALSILRESSDNYAGAISWLARELDFPVSRTLYVTFIGSVFVKERVRILPQLIERRVHEHLGERPVEFLSLKAPPVAGAVLWAARSVGFDADPESVCAKLAEAGL